MSGPIHLRLYNVDLHENRLDPENYFPPERFGIEKGVRDCDHILENGCCNGGLINFIKMYADGTRFTGIDLDKMQSLSPINDQWPNLDVLKLVRFD